MATLKSPKHEKYAQARAQGKTIDQAYALAGYTRNRGNAARLNANESIRARVSELLEASATKVMDEIEFDVRSIMTRIARRAEAAAQGGDHRAALDGEKFIATSLGFADQPSLVHDLLKTGLLQHHPQQTPAGPALEPPKVLRFADSVDAIRKARDRYDK